MQHQRMSFHLDVVSEIRDVRTLKLQINSHQYYAVKGRFCRFVTRGRLGLPRHGALGRDGRVSEMNLKIPCRSNGVSQAMIKLSVLMRTSYGLMRKI